MGRGGDGEDRWGWNRVDRDGESDGTEEKVTGNGAGGVAEERWVVVVVVTSGGGEPGKLSGDDDW